MILYVLLPPINLTHQIDMSAMSRAVLLLHNLSSTCGQFSVLRSIHPIYHHRVVIYQAFSGY